MKLKLCWPTSGRTAILLYKITPLLVNRLVNLANPDLPQQYHRRTFKSTLGHVGFQQHLLVANVQTLEEAVQVGSKYLQIGWQVTSRQESTVAQCDIDDKDDVQVKSTNTDANRQMLDVLTKLTQDLTG